MSAQPALAQEGAAIRNMLGVIGVLPAPQDDIQYRERAPLVVPPATGLRTPQAPTAERRANWPKDPDVEARKAAARDSLLPATEREKYIQGQRPLLSQEEIRRGRIQGGTPTTPYRSQFDESPFETMTAPIIQGRELAARRAANAVDSVKLGQEPPRRYLSDPPEGLRKPAGAGEFTRTREAPAPVESRFGQTEFQQEQNRR
ncbi:MAG: hypothetical protein ACRCWO_02870 [Bosea sp. (in: a-proteobacteria)]